MNTTAPVLIGTMTLLIIATLAFKYSLHFQYLRVKNKKKPGRWSDFFTRTFQHKDDPRWWRESVALFPLLFPVEFTGHAQIDAWLLKIKRTNIALYFLLIVFLLTGIYFSKISELTA